MGLPGSRLFVGWTGSWVVVGACVGTTLDSAAPELPGLLVADEPGTEVPGNGAPGAGGVCTTVTVDGPTVSTWVVGSGTGRSSAAGASPPPPPRFATATATAATATAAAPVIAKRLPRRGRGTSAGSSGTSATAASGNTAGNPRLTS